MVGALAAFGAPLQGTTEADFWDGESFFSIGSQPNRIDILQTIPGVSFSFCWDRRTEIDLNFHKIPFIALEDLITAKQAAGRLQDLADVEKLQIALALRQKSP